MTIHILSKTNFEKSMLNMGINDENVEQQDAFFISILGTVSFNWNPAERVPYFKESHSNVMTLYFDDTLRDFEYEGITYRAMNSIQAYSLYSFIKYNANNARCFIHCLAGISRSGAVGEFVCDYTESDYSEFKKINSTIKPNSHIKNLLHNEWRNDASISI